MADYLTRRETDRRGTPLPGAMLATGAGALVVVTLGPAIGGPWAVALALAAFLSGALVMLAGLQRGYPHAEFGAGNAVTTLRMALAALLLAAVAGGTDSTASAWTLPVAATHPINGGKAPAAPPITIFCGVLGFSQMV